MNILITHIPNTFNYGSFMMAINLINSIVSENYNIYIDAGTEVDLERVKKEVGNKKIFRFNMNDIKGKNKIVYRLKRLKKISRNFKYHIVLGGDDISEYYSKRSCISNLIDIYITSKKVKTFLVGQTIGPFTSYRKILVKKLLSRCKIYTRDIRTLEYLEKIGLENVKEGRDLAFLSLPRQGLAKRILDKYKLKENEYITVVPSGLVTYYTNNRKNYILEYETIVKELLNNKLLMEKKVVMLPHVIRPKGCDDRDIIKEIMESISSSRVTPIYDEMLASDAREILGKGIFTITGRMHAAVSTFYMRKPAVSLSYSVKYKGVISEGLSMEDLVIEAANEDLWKQHIISRRVAEKVSYILKNYTDLVNKIDINVSETSEIADNMLNSLKKEMNYL